METKTAISATLGFKTNSGIFGILTLLLLSDMIN